MATHTGTLTSDVVQTPLASSSPGIAVGVENNFTLAVVVAGGQLRGAQANGTQSQPVDAHTGLVISDFADLWYNHLHILPNRIDVGNLTSQQIRPIEIFNGFFVSRTVTGVAGTTVEGTTFSVPTPDVFAPLQSKLRNLQISTTGAPNFSGFYSVTLDTAQVLLLYVTGKRVLPVTFQHNWSSKVIERLAYLTSIMESEAGIEQARMLRKYPRRTLEYDFLLASTQTNAPRLRALYNALMFGWQHRTFAVPVWTDATRLAVQADAGQPVIQVPTTFFDYDAGNYLMLWQDEENYEIVEIQSLTSTTVTATVNLVRTWAANRTVVMPARLGVVSPVINVTKHSVDIESVPMAFELLPQAYSSNRLVAGARVLYRGLHVLLAPSNHQDKLDVSINRPHTRNDADVGYFSIDATNPAPHTSQEYEWLMADHRASSDFFAWLDSRKGRFTPVWVPTWAHDMQVVANIGGTATSFIINGIGYASLYSAGGVPAASRRDVMVRMVDGIYYFRRITGGTLNDDGTETIAIDSAFGTTLAASNIDRVCFLVPSRLEADAVELAWESGNVAHAAFKLADLLDDTI